MRFNFDATGPSNSMIEFPSSIALLEYLDLKGYTLTSFLSPFFFFASKENRRSSSVYLERVTERSER